MNRPASAPRCRRPTVGAAAARAALIAVLLACFMAEGIAFTRSNSQTFDEAVYLAAGYDHLTRRDFRLLDESPPMMSELAAVPIVLRYGASLGLEARRDLSDQWQVASRFLYASGVEADRLLFWGRLPNLLGGSILVGVVGLWCYRLWGFGGALLGMTLAALDPTLLAHASLATTDLGVSLFLFLSFYFAWEHATRPRLWLPGAMGASLGLALASKFSGVFACFCLPLVVGIHVLLGGDFGLAASLGRSAAGKRAGARLLEAAGTLTLAGLVAVGVLWSAYLFTDLSRWWSGFWLQVEHQRSGHPAFLLGRYSLHGWTYYFPIAFLLKSPLGTLALIATSLLGLRFGKAMAVREGLFLLVPVALYFALACSAATNTGVRYILPVYPFLFVVAARTATIRLGNRWLMPAAVGAAALGTVASSLSAAPHQLAFFNRLVGGPAAGFRYLSDSNVDWGQDLRNLKRYLDRNATGCVYLSYFGTAPPDYYGIDHVALPGFSTDVRSLSEVRGHPRICDTLAVSVTNLQGVYEYEMGQRQFAWLDDRQPSARIGHSIFVYDIAGDAVAHLRLAGIFRRAGMVSDPGYLAFAAEELRYVLTLRPNDPLVQQLLEEVEELMSQQGEPPP